MQRDVCTQVEEFLRERHFKLTGPRREVIRILHESRTPLSVQEVHQQLQDIKADLASVYRTINLLCELGVLTRLDFQEKLYRYELSAPFTPHHHHLICKKCGNIENVFEQCLPAGFEEKIRQRSGFEIESHILEFYGICETCAEQTTSGP